MNKILTVRLLAMISIIIALMAVPFATGYGGGWQERVGRLWQAALGGNTSTEIVPSQKHNDRFLASAASGGNANDHESVRGEGGKFPVDVRRPSGPPVIELKEGDWPGRTGAVSCSTCHSLRPANMGIRQPADLRAFHQGMPFRHGTLACYGCHNPADADTLRFADGAAVAYTDVMQLCGQCHSKQFQAYQRGDHGGMTGYWDLSRGPRQRNNCVDCHDPHVPKFPDMIPTFKAHDRFLQSKSYHE
ncbi:MAG: cytochrome c3 family protein [Pirellulaceae bacterium]|nr:hypothetical protein [Planctomycetales bacterium]